MVVKNLSVGSDNFLPRLIWEQSQGSKRQCSEFQCVQNTLFPPCQQLLDLCVDQNTHWLFSPCLGWEFRQDVQKINDHCQQCRFSCHNILLKYEKEYTVFEEF